MHREKQHDPEPRGRALARLLAEALGSATETSDAPGDSGCPEPEVLAAYADHGLDPEETRKWEGHFAGCSRCRKILAVLTVNSDEPLSQQEVERFGQLAAQASIEAAPASSNQTEAAPARRRKHWRWLVPALGAAAAAMLWFALRPGTSGRGPAPQQMAEKSPPAASAAPGTSEMAQANTPPAQPSPTAPPAAARTLQAVPQGSAARAKIEKGHEQAANAATQARSSAPATAAEGIAPRESQGQRRAETANAPAPAAAPSPTAAGKPAEQALRVPDAAARSRALAIGGGLGGVAAPVFASPDRNVLWRIGPGGTIDRSMDDGRTWKKQTSGVSAELLAGVATSEETAWIAGRGVILRTTDGGDHWQRVSPPGGKAADWTAITASDALHVTVVAKDQRRFRSDDGGQSWTPQP